MADRTRISIATTFIAFFILAALSDRSHAGQAEAMAGQARSYFDESAASPAATDAPVRLGRLDAQSGDEQKLKADKIKSEKTPKNPAMQDFRRQFVSRLKTMGLVMTGAAGLGIVASAMAGSFLAFPIIMVMGLAAILLTFGPVILIDYLNAKSSKKQPLIADTTETGEKKL
ncbi:MAG: hypothetical protein HYT79_07055 [Elusimicrobia bacterium]|nr:hypothetical protein [Elusimicrobiota bacterium]